MLVRDSAAGPEVFLQRRVRAMAFAAGMTVFPGGGVDPSDATADIAWAGPEPRWWGEQFGIEAGRAQALVCAAVRETFEECGVLLAGPTPDSVVCDTSGYAEARRRIEKRELSFPQFLADANLVLRADLLRPWDNWVTPTVEQRRYDTRFFVALLPTGQEADGATSEAAAARWSTPADALDRWKAEEDILMPPTWTQLTSLGRFDSTAAMLAATPAITPIQPTPVFADGRIIRLEFPNWEQYMADLPGGILGGRKPN
ncbi:NUDIX hydrolase [Nocardia stercoris]|nr:NUDIX hydrolase [Nocardia stercoris]